MTTDTVTADVVSALTKRVEQLEYKVSQMQSAANPYRHKSEDLFADNAMLAHTFRAILDAEGITGEPIGAEELQNAWRNSISNRASLAVVLSKCARSSCGLRLP